MYFQIILFLQSVHTVWSSGQYGARYGEIGGMEMASQEATSYNYNNDDAENASTLVITIIFFFLIIYYYRLAVALQLLHKPAKDGL